MSRFREAAAAAELNAAPEQSDAGIDTSSDSGSGSEELEGEPVANTIINLGGGPEVRLLLEAMADRDLFTLDHAALPW